MVWLTVKVSEITKSILRNWKTALCNNFPWMCNALSDAFSCWWPFWNKIDVDHLFYVALFLYDPWHHQSAGFRKQFLWKWYFCWLFQYAVCLHCNTTTTVFTKKRIAVSHPKHQMTYKFAEFYYFKTVTLCHCFPGNSLCFRFWSGIILPV